MDEITAAIRRMERANEAGSSPSSQEVGGIMRNLAHLYPEYTASELFSMRIKNIANDQLKRMRHSIMSGMAVSFLLHLRLTHRSRRKSLSQRRLNLVSYSSAIAGQ
jgi:hypothetical protein